MANHRSPNGERYIVQCSHCDADKEIHPHELDQHNDYFCHRECKRDYYQYRLSENQERLWQTFKTFTLPATAADLARATGFSHNGCLGFLNKAEALKLVEWQYDTEDTRRKIYTKL